MVIHQDLDLDVLLEGGHVDPDAKRTLSATSQGDEWVVGQAQVFLEQN